MQTKAYAALTATTPIVPHVIERRAPNANDVSIKILFCGICHSDLHTARGEWAGTQYPCVPGHEIVGEVVEVGNKVTKFKQGDLVGVGCMVDSCRQCESCKEDLEQYCEGPAGFTGTYNGPMRGGKNTHGGYSQAIVVDEHFALTIKHDKKDLAGVAPLLCAGITTYSPLKHWDVKAGKKVGVVGIGGLGHMGVKLAKAMNAHVVAFTTSHSKVAEAHKLGADEVVISTDEKHMHEHVNTFDFILNTVAAPHNLDIYTNLLKRDGTMTLVGVPASPHQSPNVSNLIMKRCSIAGSLIGGVAQTQEMLDFCAKHNITADIELIAAENINNAYERMLKGDIKYRFVIDNNSI